MGYRFFTAFAALSLAATIAAGQSPSKASKSWTAPRTADGHPDLQGVWSNATITPLERPGDLAGKQVFTPEEAAEYQKEVVQRSNVDNRSSDRTADVASAYNEFWFDRGTKVIGSRRTALVIDPPDGRVPALTPKGQANLQQTLIRGVDGPEDRSLAERCLLWRTAGPPMLPGPYNNYFQILQTSGSVAILSEMIHDVRVIPLDGRPHLPATVRLWMGDSRGHWKGDTLVVDTTNFTDKTRFRGADENLHLTERFTRAGADSLLYEFTVDDPTAFAKPWTAQIPVTRSDERIFEYACHEGNYAMVDILAGARSAEKATASPRPAKGK
jgi:hypothetical protein